MAYSDIVNALNPIHYWTLEGNSNDTGTGVLLNGTDTAMEYDSSSVVAGVVNNASFNLNGSIAIASSTDLDNMITTTKTISLWNTPTLDTLGFGILNIGNSTNGIYLNIAAGMVPMVGIVSGGVSDTYFGSSVKINEPTHFLLEYNAGAVKLYQNNVLVVDVTSSFTSIPASTAGSNIGKGTSIRVGTGTFTTYDNSCKMSNVAVWNSILSTVDRESLYTEGDQEVTRSMNFLNIPDKTEIRCYDIDNSLVELGGLEFAGGVAGDTLSVDFNVLVTKNVKIAIINVENKYEVFYADVVLGRYDYNYDVSLLLVEDRNYNNDGWAQPIPVSNVTAPYLTGNAVPGNVLTCNAGVWTGSAPVTLTYQWYRNGVLIPGETTTTYTVLAGDEDLPLFCRETATNTVNSLFVDTATRTYINTKIYGIWYDSVGSQAPTTTWVDVSFDATKENINASFSTADNKSFVLPAGSDWLVIATMKYDDTSNNRVNPEAKVVYTGTGTDSPVYGSGFSRDSNNRTSFVRTMSYIKNAAQGDTVKIQHRSDTDTLLGGSIAQYCHLQIINLSALSMGAYNDTTDVTGYGTQVWNDIIWNNNLVENGTNIVRSGNDITLAANKTYLISYGIAMGGGGSRTQRISRALINNVEVPSSYSYAYQRNTANEYMDIGSIFLYQTGGTSEVCKFQCQRGTADVDGTVARRVNTSSCFVLELDNPTWYSSSDTVGGQDVTSTADLPINVFDTELQTSPDFTKNTSSQITKNGAKYMLMGASMFATQVSTSGGVRLSRGLKFTVSGAEIKVGQSGNYLRGNQSTQDTYDISLGIVGVVFLQDGDTVKIESFDAGQDGTSTTPTIANRNGFWALDINSI